MRSLFYHNLKYLTILLSALSFAYNVYAQDVVIDLDTMYQTIEGIGASDCWTVQYVGKYWSEQEKERAARLLFSRKSDKQGNPEGIGLSIWRFNIGAGTMEQGDSSDLNTDITRRAECFIDAAGNYDWSKQSGQQWFLQRAKDYGCETFVAFTNSPPVYFTRNGKGYAQKDGRTNLRDDKYDDFADFLVTVIDKLKRKGINFDYISPFNEPQWDWSNTYQEGCPWHNDEMKRFMCVLDDRLQTKHLPTKIMISEAGSWENLYEQRNRASNQIYAFFDRQSPSFIGDLASVPKEIGGHSYWTDEKNDKLKDVRLKVRSKAAEYGLKVYQTEWSLLSNTPLDGIDDYADATYMDIALYMSKVIYADLVYAQTVSWSFWTSMDVESHGYKNRYNLLRLETPDADIPSIVKGGKVTDVKTLWVLGHYSRFVRPGYIRVDVRNCDDLRGVFGSAYISDDGKRVVAVLNNMSNEVVKIPVTLKGIAAGKRIKRCDMYVTDNDMDMKLKNDLLNDNGVLLLPKSVNTIVYIL